MKIKQSLIGETMLVLQLYSVGRLEFGIITFNPWLSRFQGIYNLNEYFTSYFQKRNLILVVISNKIEGANLDVYATQ